jgi:hypothetical protein
MLMKILNGRPVQRNTLVVGVGQLEIELLTVTWSEKAFRVLTIVEEALVDDYPSHPSRRPGMA